MILKSITLQDFRNYTKSLYKFSPKITVILGENARGKTNLLEAVFLLSTGKSFKAYQDKEMIAFNENLARVKGVIKQSSRLPGEESAGTIELEMILTTGEVTGIKTPLKKYSVNGNSKRMIDFAGVLKSVLFWPEDLELVTDSPGRRRRYLDYVLLQTDREYRRSLLSYEKGVRQRNRVLEAIRDEGASRSQLIFWDQLIIKTGQYLSKKREEYLHFVNNFKFQIPNFKVPRYHLIYDKSEISEERLRQYSEEEIAAAVTLVGPHRDDFEFRIKNLELRITKEEYRNLSQYGSRGEQRLAILWMKIGELSYIENVSDEKPVLLLDDIFSELDHEHRDIVFDIIGGHQTIMTTTDLHHIEKSQLGKVEVIEL